MFHNVFNIHGWIAGKKRNIFMYRGTMVPKYAYSHAAGCVVGTHLDKKCSLCLLFHLGWNLPYWCLSTTVPNNLHKMAVRQAIYVIYINASIQKLFGQFLVSQLSKVGRLDLKII